MADHQESWVIPPQSSGTYGLVVRLGEGYELSEAAVEALETLARELAHDDVSGFMRGIGGCGGTFEFCSDGVCTPKSNMPCATYSQCRICIKS